MQGTIHANRPSIRRAVENRPFVRRSVEFEGRPDRPAELPGVQGIDQNIFRLQGDSLAFRRVTPARRDNPVRRVRDDLMIAAARRVIGTGVFICQFTIGPQEWLGVCKVRSENRLPYGHYGFRADELFKVGPHYC